VAEPSVRPANQLWRSQHRHRRRLARRIVVIRGTSREPPSSHQPSRPSRETNITRTATQSALFDFFAHHIRPIETTRDTANRRVLSSPVVAFCRQLRTIFSDHVEYVHRERTDRNCLMQMGLLFAQHYTIKTVYFWYFTNTARLYSHNTYSDSVVIINILLRTRIT